MRALSAAVAGLVALLLLPEGHAAELPRATQKLLADLKLAPAILSGLDKELDVPKAWIEGAQREAALRVSGTWDPDQFRRMNLAFLERYPFVKQSYTRGNRQERVLAPLIAFQSGRSTMDVMSGIGAAFGPYKEAGALEDLRDLPNFDNVPVGMRDEDGLWVGERLRYWCMSYNTNLVGKEHLPASWDDLLTDPIWRDHRLAIADRPNLWIGNIWAAPGYGEAWGKRFIAGLFTQVQPQVRKEGANALVTMVVAGEFYGAVPSADFRTRQYADKGAPVGWHCPLPVPMSISEMGMLKGNPHQAASKLWISWFLSKEGQIAQYEAIRSPPVHRALQTKEFLSFPEQIVGRRMAFREPGQLERDLPHVFEAWNPWFQGTPSGQKPQ
jgi:ABC-type Fe3+ transport system substrate-binding protein